MKARFLQHLLIVQLLVSVSFAGDLRVNIINGTTNEPGKADRVALLDLTAGMAEIASANDVIKSMTFSDVASTGQNQYLVRATLGGVNYSAMFVPTPGVNAWETSLTVYESSETVHGLKASVPFFVIYGFEDKLKIQKRIVLENISVPPVTFNSTPGIAKVHIPKDVIELDNLTFKSGSMPVRTSPIDTDFGQVIPNPIKPGVSEIDMEYNVAYDPNGTDYSELVSYDIEHFHVYVMPIGLQVTAPGLSREGTDQENGLAIYAIEGVKAGTNLVFNVSGAGMPESGPAEQEQQQQNTGRIVIENRIDASVELAIAGVLILVVLISLFVSLTRQNEDLKLESITMLKSQKSDLLKQYSKMAKSAANDEEKDKVLYRLVSVYKTLDRIK